MAYRTHLMMCAGTACVSSGSFEVKKVLEEEIRKAGLEDEIAIVSTGCNGFCAQGPIMVVQPEGIFYQKLIPEVIPYLVEEHFLKGRPLKELMYTPPDEESPVPKIQDIGFFQKQRLIALRNKGLIDPEEIDDYIARDGYRALAKALTEMTPEDIIEEMKTSGLRGRGGAGFPTGLKWEFCKRAKGMPKYVVCNADEGDPGAYMDRSIIESDPHAVLEGMLIGARAMGSEEGFVYIRSEYPLAVQRLKLAISQAREYGLLGDDIFDTGFNFDIEIKQGAGAFVCGEETALMASIMGYRGMPRPRPPFPANSGLWGKPTNINNVETWSNVPKIILRGGDWFSSIGTEEAKGTKVFSLVGKVCNTGLVEVPMGIELKEIIYDIGGGAPDGKEFKAVQMGGPSGGCLPRSRLDLPVDYKALTEAGAIMGSGGMVVMDEDTCMVDIARFFLTFIQDESCGKCTPCRIGTKRMLEILINITEGRGQEGDIEKLLKLCAIIKKGSLCGLGQTAPNPVLSTIRYFRDEYIEHIRYHKCDASVCQELFSAPCANTCPAETNVPGYIQLLLDGRYADAYRLNRESNPFPAICGRVCFHPCEGRCRRSQIDEPISIATLKRAVADKAFELNDDSIFKMKELPSTGKRVAVIGAGPGGLSAAYFLKRLGHDVTVYEAHSRAGGMMVLGIPPYRLPREIIQREIDALVDMGIDIRLNTKVGTDVHMSDMVEENHAVFVAVGANREWNLGIENEHARGVISGIAMLREIGLGGEAKVAQNVLVIGGGNTAIDAARAARRLGAEVTIVYRRERRDMPAFEEEIEEALEEGVGLRVLLGPAEVLTDGNGKVDGLKCVMMSLGSYDDSGRKRPVPIEGSEFVMECDTVITAIGQAPDTDFLAEVSPRITRRNGTIKTNKWVHSTDIDGVFAGGDAVRGPQTAIRAIADGKEAAGSVDEYLMGRNRLEDIVDNYEYSMKLPDNQEESLRIPVRKMEAEDRKQRFDEVCLGYTSQEFIGEASRCLRCDIREIDEEGGEDEGGDMQ